jgi:hypothetical protein
MTLCITAVLGGVAVLVLYLWLKDFSGWGGGG